MSRGLGLGLFAVAAGGGPNPEVGKYKWCVVLSSAIVRAPRWVCTFSSTLKVFASIS